MLGKHLSKETKKKLSLRFSGDNNPNSFVSRRKREEMK